MSNDKKSFLMYKDWRNLLCSLDVKQKGELLDGVFKFQCDGEISDFDGDKALQGILNFFISTFEQDNEKYNETRKKNKRNIEKRWNNTNVYDRIQSNTNYTDNDNDNDIDNENGKVNENLSVEGNAKEKVWERENPSVSPDTIDWAKQMEQLRSTKNPTIPK